MTPYQLLQVAVLRKAAELNDADPPEVTEGNIESLWDKLCETDTYYDAKGEVRGGEVETGLKCEWSRHYESRAVAANINGQWVGWIYWYGGGKHGEPQEVDWMEYAYLLDCKEEEKTVTVRIFTVAQPTEAGATP